MELNICHLYPDILNLYGDRGNILCMQKRLEWRGIGVTVTGVSIGQALEASAYDLLFVGGGQDFEQEVLLGDLAGAKTEELKSAIEDGLPVLAICGGYQMLGQSVSDPDGVEGGGTLKGLGLLPADTVFQGEKTRTRVTGAFRAPEGIFSAMAGVPFEGYEIHMGRTESAAAPLVDFTTQTGERHTDGLSSGNVWGCYVHGIFDKAGAAEALVNALLEAKGLEPGAAAVDWQDYAQGQYDRLADGLRESLDLPRIYRILNGAG